MATLNVQLLLQFFLIVRIAGRKYSIRATLGRLAFRHIPCYAVAFVS